ncbi:hypothetical protein ABZ172_04895 [Streptomyces sp. NPDC006296]|uniref:hypothetical protein n=1 Tax=Streptomyces sp. NPDC006296 TaxID=3156746 RepID=UPI0033A7A518
MFVLRSTHRALQADYERVLEQRDAARREVRAGRTATRTAAGQYTSADATLHRVRLARITDAVRYGHRIERLARAVVRLRQALAAETRRAGRLQAAYDSAVGLDSPALDLGTQWQQTRTDKPKAVKG